MKTWYRITEGSNEIEQVEIEKETEQYLYINTRRVAKNSRFPFWDMYFPTEKDARDCLILEIEQNIQILEKKLKKAKEDLHVIEQEATKQ